MKLLMAWLLLVCCFMGKAAWAADAAMVHLETHKDFERVVFEFNKPTSFSIEHEADSVVLHFGTSGAVSDLATETQLIKGIVGGEAAATIALTPGSQVQSKQLGRRIIVDVRATGLPKPATNSLVLRVASESRKAGRFTSGSKPSQGPTGVEPDHVAPKPLSLVTPPTTDVKPDVAMAGPPTFIIPGSEVKAATAATATAIQVPPNSLGPIAISASVVKTSAGGDTTSLLLPFAKETGAAAFRHGAEAWLVFDEPRPIDIASSQDQSAYTGAAVQVLPEATLIHFPLDQDKAVSLRRVERGWIVTIDSAAPILPPLTPIVQGTRLLFSVASSAHVIAVADPATGQNLEVATFRLAGPGVPVSYRAPQFNILSSWQGIVLEPLSDRTVMRYLPEGVVVETGDPLSVTPDSARALADAAVLTRRFDFPALPVPDLLHRLQAQMADESAAPPQDRLLPRKAAAQTMLALGLGAEAQSLLQLAVAEDPRAVDNPDIRGLSAIAALISGRASEADGLLDPRLTGSDEISLWRAALAATRQEGSPEAARLFAATAKLILSYPAALRDHLLPLAAETMARGGAMAGADALLAKLPDEPNLALARAIDFETKGNSGSALSLYDALASSRDRLVSARAAARAVRLRLATHAIGPSQAADKLERGFLDWRGDDRERDLRLEVVDLRTQAGEWRKAFNLLRETASLYPDDAAKFQSRTTELLTTLLQDNKTAMMSPLDLVMLAEENAEEAAKAAPDEVTALLADKLVALDLPKQAEPVLEKMIAAAPPGGGRAALGARLASMRLAEGDAVKAEAALSESDAPGLSPALAEQRGLLEARVHAQNHDIAGSAAILSKLDTAAADDLRATVLTSAGDWQGAEAALRSLAGRTVPDIGLLTSNQQDVLLRLASAEARAGDEDAARELGIKEATRMAGPRSDMFRLLTAAPVTGLGDLRRSAGELAMARTIPAGLAAIGSR